MRERSATATRAARDVERLKPLVAKEEIAQQQFDAAVSTADAAQATAEAARSRCRRRAAPRSPWPNSAPCRPALGATRAEASLALGAGPAPEQLQVTRARAAAADARVEAGGSQRWRRRSSTSSAPRSRRRPTASSASSAIELGQQVQPGQPLFAIVSRDDVWVVGQLQGDAARGDAPGPARHGRGRRARRPRRFTGKVDSIGAATGARVQPAAARERHRQLRQGRAARAGEDRARRQARIRSTCCAPACR